MCELLSPGKSSQNVFHSVFFQNSPQGIISKADLNGRQSEFRKQLIYGEYIVDKFG